MNTLNHEESELLADSKYRSYVTQVERALKAFEYTSEWADLISSLGKLNKVLSSNIKYPVIPRRVTIGKRLAQCLHPALPSGVHLKVLETYDIIFKCIGTQRLAADLFTYSAGLFPLLGYAAMNVRPALLSLYEAHFVALRQHVKPALTGLIMGLLPGIEDASEHSVKTTHLLEDFCYGVGPSFFYSSLWECVLSSPSNRLAAINYVLGHYNRKLSLEDQLHVIGTNISVLVDALSSSLQDANVLVQRSTLDLLLCTFPMHCNHLPHSDTVTLVTAAVNVVLRRDSSLNRRLYAWLIGTDSNGLPIAMATTSSEQLKSAGDTDLQYFEAHSKKFLIQAIRNILYHEADRNDRHGSSVPVSIRPFKILMILLDKQEIGSAILEEIFLDMLRCLHRECAAKTAAKTSKTDSELSEIIKTANLLLGGMEPSFIWKFIGNTLELACQHQKNDRTVSIGDICDIVNFLLEKLSMEAYKETQTVHLPSLLLDAINSLLSHVDNMADVELVALLRLMSKIFVHIQPSLTLVVPFQRNKEHRMSHFDPRSSDSSGQDSHSAEGTRIPAAVTSGSNDDVGKLLAEHDNFCDFVQFEDKSSNEESLMQKCVRSYLKLFTKFVDASFSKNSELFIRQLSLKNCRGDNGSESEKDKLETGIDRICPTNATKAIVEGFTFACQLLVDLSAIPVGLSLSNATSSGVPDNRGQFPDWLQRLLLCACAVSHVGVEMCAVSTLLDLIVLTQSSLASQCQQNLDQLSTTGATRVLIKPLLTACDLEYLNSSTSFYQVIATNMWKFLDDKSPDCHIRAVSLLNQLHQISPDHCACENVIISDLLSTDKAIKLNARSRFAILWHLSRDRMMSNDKQNMLDRSLLIMLDGLQRSTSDNLCFDITRSWLIQVVERGDLIRVLEPLFILLLHPDTARVSIQHVTVHKTHNSQCATKGNQSVTSSDQGESKIYIMKSTEGGSVIFHVSPPSVSPYSTDDLQTYSALMALNDQSSSQRTVLFSDVTLDKIGRESVSRLTITDGDVFEDATATISKQPAVSEGLFFDDNQCSQPSDVIDVDVIVAEVIDELISRVFNEEKTVLPSGSCSELNQVCDSVDRKSIDVKNATLEDTQRRQRPYRNGFIVETTALSSSSPPALKVNQLYTHVLLYTRKFDAKRAVYAFDRLIAVLETSPRLVVRSLATSNVGGSSTPRSSLIQLLLSQHKRSVLGHRFNTDDVESVAASVTSIRSSMFVEVLLMVSLYYLRSQFPNLLAARIDRSDLADNCQLQILSINVLVMVLKELTNITQTGGRGFATYVVDLLDKCKFQKTVLHSLIGSVHNSRCRVNNASNGVVDIGDSILVLNDSPGSVASATLQSHLLHLVHATVQLEHTLAANRTESNVQTSGGPPSEWDKFDPNTPLTSASLRFLSNRPFVQQPMLLLSISSALRQQHMCVLHRHWIGFFVSLLPFLGRTLPRFVTTTVSQICRNLELFSSFYERGASRKDSNSQLTKLPPDHTVMLLDGLITIFQYCLSDSSSQQEFGHSFSHASLGTSQSSNLDGGLLSGLASVFHMANSREPTPNKDDYSSFNPRLEARSSLLKMLPHVLSSLTVLWKAIHIFESHSDQRNSGQQPYWILGSPKVIRQGILDLISPLALNHCVHLLAAVASVWNDRRQPASATKRVACTVNGDQLILVDVTSAIKLLSLESMMQSIRLIIKQPPQQAALNSNNSTKYVPVEVGLLKFLHKYIERVESTALGEFWPLLLLLLREALQINLTPPGLFTLINILHEFMHKVPMFDERKHQKDLQEVTQKLFESCAQVAGSSLEQTTFFRRNLAVKPGPQLDVSSEVDEEIMDAEVADQSLVSSPDVVESVPRSLDATREYQQYSVQALQLLSDVTSVLLDMVYRSDEKERVVPLLTTILGNVFPYLKSHTVHNLPSYRACSQMLSNLSSYQYTRKAWKREVFDLMMETNFFQMDAMSISSWRVLIDNLMTHDRTTFRDLLVRVNLAQSSTLNLFISREAEYEQRAQLLKRLSFVIFCSEIDQYQRHMPEIQEKLADCLRVPSALPVLAQVFLCFRVLILRISPQHLTSLWPTIITELVHLMLLFEQELTPITENDLNGSSKLSNHDASWTAVNGSADVIAPAYINLFMAACKLLDLALILPADFLPQFQLYRWAFTGDCGLGSSESEKHRHRDQLPSFIPHVVRIARCITAKFGNVPLLTRQPQRPLLAPNRGANIQDLCSFFVTLNASMRDGSGASCAIPPTRLAVPQTNGWMSRAHSAPNISHAQHSSIVWSADAADESKLQPMEYIERLVLKDFMEAMLSK